MKILCCSGWLCDSLKMCSSLGNVPGSTVVYCDSIIHLHTVCHKESLFQFEHSLNRGASSSINTYPTESNLPLETTDNTFRKSSLDHKKLLDK